LQKDDFFFGLVLLLFCLLHKKGNQVETFTVVDFDVAGILKVINLPPPSLESSSNHNVALLVYNNQQRHLLQQPSTKHQAECVFL